MKTARRWPSISLGERPQKKLIFPTPWSQTFTLQNFKKMNFCCLSHQPVALCYGCPSKLIQEGSNDLSKVTQLISREPGHKPRSSVSKSLCFSPHFQCPSAKTTRNTHYGEVCSSISARGCEKGLLHRFIWDCVRQFYGSRKQVGLCSGLATFRKQT